MVQKLKLNQLPTWKEHEDNRVFNLLLIIALVVTVLFTLVVKVVDLPERTREEVERIPPQLVKIQEQKVEVEPEPEPEPEPEAEPEAEPEEVVEAEAEPEPEVASEPEPTPQTAREKAQNSGLLAMTDALSQMRESVDMDSLAQNNLEEGGGDAEQTERMLLGKTVAGTSGGVASGSLSSDVGSGNGLEGRKTTEFTARVPTDGGGAGGAAAQSRSEMASGNRTTESIRQTFDKNKGALYSIYRRALREDPSLQGKVTINLVITPQGRVQNVNIVSSDLAHDDLIKKLLARIRLIDFGKMDVNETELNYTFNFLPF